MRGLPAAFCKNHPDHIAFVKSRKLCRNCYNREPDQVAKRLAWKRRDYRLKRRFYGCIQRLGV